VNFWSGCDLAKFAQASFSPEECQVAFATAQELIEQTAPASSQA